MVAKRAWGLLTLGVLFLGGCLSVRLTAEQVVQGAQRALHDVGLCHLVLDVEFETDLLKDSVTIEVWEQGLDWLRIQVLSAATPQLRGLAFATDGQQSIMYSAHSGEVLLGPADVVRMPSVVEQLVLVWKEWVQNVDPQQARLLARERDAGLVVYRIEIPLAGGGYAQYWIDAGAWWVRQVVYQDELLGTGHIVVRDMACTADGGPTLDVRSALDVPAGIPIKEVVVEEDRPLTLEEAQVSVNFPLCTPTYLPGDTKLTAAYHLDKNVALIYTGQLSFSLVQGRKNLQIPEEQATLVPLRGGQAYVIQDRERDGIVLVWQEDGIQYSIAGALPQDEAVRVAQSLEAVFKSSTEDQAVGSKEGQGQ